MVKEAEHYKNITQALNSLQSSEYKQKKTQFRKKFDAPMEKYHLGLFHFVITSGYKILCKSINKKLDSFLSDLEYIYKQLFSSFDLQLVLYTLDEARRSSHQQKVLKKSRKIYKLKKLRDGYFVYNSFCKINCISRGDYKKRLVII